MKMQKKIKRFVYKAYQVSKSFVRKSTIPFLIGFANYFHYVKAPDGQRVHMTIRGHSICLRKGAPDLGVAVNCLCRGEFRAIARFLDYSYEGFIVDAGGYIGTAALALGDMYPHATIISIEPSKENLELLRQNVSGNPNIKVLHGALVGSDSASDSRMLRNRGTGAWGFTIVENPRGKSQPEDLHQVTAFKLNALGVDPMDIGLLKLDIEGGELDLLVNDRETLDCVEIVIAELHDSIILGCLDAWKEFSKGRVSFKTKGEKYISVRKAELPLKQAGASRYWCGRALMQLADQDSFPDSTRT